MKTIKFFFNILLPFGLMGILFQGCYTQFATMREEEPSYQQPPPCAVQNDSAYYGEDYDNWQSHQNLGLAYYYPCWNSYWSWDYGCVYPSVLGPMVVGSCFLYRLFLLPALLGIWELLSKIRSLGLSWIQLFTSVCNA